MFANLRPKQCFDSENLNFGICVKSQISLCSIIQNYTELWHLKSTSKLLILDLNNDTHPLSKCDSYLWKKSQSPFWMFSKSTKSSTSNINHLRGFLSRLLIFVGSSQILHFPGKNVIRLAWLISKMAYYTGNDARNSFVVCCMTGCQCIE